MSPKANFRFYEELNDFLPRDRKKIAFTYDFRGNPSVKDAIEAIGIPHTEVDLILANGKSVSFAYHLRDGDMISVYPVFESLDISPVIHLREKPLRNPKFILDVHLGKLAKYLRLLGIDTLYENDWDDKEIVCTAIEQKRTILTRDVSLLKMKKVTHGYRIRSSIPFKQAEEVVCRFDLHSSIKPFHRCLVCNGIIIKTDKENVENVLEEQTKHYYNEFYQCSSCRKVYWKGSHYMRMKQFIDIIIQKKPVK